MIGKLLAGTIGLIMGGPLGALAGVALGDIIDRKNDYPNRLGGPSENELSSQYFFVCTFALLGKIAKADGRVSEKEIEHVTYYMDHVLKLDPKSRAFAINIFKEAKDSQTPFTEYAEQFYSLFAHRRQTLEDFLYVLLRLAESDGPMTHAEAQMLIQIGVIFGFREQEMKRFFRAYTSDIHSASVDQTQKAFDTLGLSNKATVEEIKKRYRELAKEHHPDRLISKGLPEEFIKSANEKFSQIKASYDYLKGLKGFR